MTYKQIKEKIEVGDFTTLGKMLNKNAEAARARFKREKEDAVKGMEKIVTQRDAMIEESKNELKQA